jgi:amino acid transporter
MSATTEQAGADRDSKDLAGFGYKQELKRGLGTFSSFAVAFSYISPSTGIFTLYFIGLAAMGGAFIWTWPVVALGQFIIALNFAEVSSHYPIAGSVFQWTKYLANRTYAWFSGWIYLFAGILTVTAVVATIPLALIPAINGLPTLFGQTEWSLSGSLHAQLLVALIVLVVITVLNIYGVRLVAIVNNTGVIFEILGMFVFALVLALFHNHQGVHVITSTAGLHVGASAFLGAMFMSLFVIYGFDTASTLAEETRDPRRAAPKAVLFSIVGAFVIGGVFLLGTLMAIPDKGTVLASGCHGVAPACQHTFATAVGAAQKAAYGPVQIIQSNFSPALATVYLLVVSAAIFVCCLSIMAATIRLGFGMARDNQLPFSGPLSKVSPNLHTPLWTAITIAVLAAVPFIQYSGAATIAVAATAMIYFSYFVGNIAILIARLKGWPKTAAPFRLGRFGLIVNVLGLLYGGAMLVNFAWPPAANAVSGPRLTSNPRPSQTGGLVNFHIGFLNGIPILWTVFAFIALVGTLYYLVAGRKKTFAPVVTPAGDDAPLSA